MRRAVRVTAALAVVGAVAWAPLLACSLLVDTSDLASGRAADAQGGGDDMRTAVDGPGTDAPSDGRGVDVADGSFGCQPGPNRFCDDFDDVNPGARWTGAVVTRGTITYEGGGLSAPNAMRSSVVAGSGYGGAYLAETFANNPNDVHCELDLKIENVPTLGEINVIDLVRGTGPDSYHVYFSSFGGSWKIAEYQRRDGSSLSRTKPLNAALPIGTWMHVSLATTGTTGTVTANGATVTLEGLANVAGPTRLIAVGLVSTSPEVQGARVLVDNFDCTTVTP